MRARSGLRGLLRPGGVVVLGLLVTGCHHRRPQTVVLPAQTPVPLEPVPSPAENAELEPTKPKLPPVPVATGEVKPKKTKKRAKAAASTATPVTPPAKPQVSDPAAAEVAAIGSLTVAGDQSPRARQEAMDLIAANDKRLAALSAEVQRTQAALVSKAKTFQRDAQQALGSGDAAGAKTLAVKGKLLLDDLEQGNAPK